MEPLRILAVTNLWPTPGSFRGVFVAEQVAGLRRLGHTVDVEVVAQSRGRADYLLAARRVRRRVRQGDYHLVHVHYGLTSLATRFAGGPPRVLSLYGSDINTRWQSGITRLTAGTPAARVYPSRRLADAAADPTGVIVPNGVDFGLFREYSPEERTAARQALGFAPDDRVIMFGAAPANPVKRYDLFTAVMAELQTRGLPARELVLAAPNQSREDVVPKFAAADVLLVTSRQGTESGPLVVKEAAIMGLPVVSVDVGDVAEVLADVTPSTVVPFGADLVPRLAGAVAKTLAEDRRGNGRTRLSRYDNDAVAARLAEVYRQAIRRSRR